MTCRRVDVQNSRVLTEEGFGVRVIGEEGAVA
jgi:hypothetical protein